MRYRITGLVFHWTSFKLNNSLADVLPWIRHRSTDDHISSKQPKFMKIWSRSKWRQPKIPKWKFSELQKKQNLTQSPACLKVYQPRGKRILHTTALSKQHASMILPLTVKLVPILKAIKHAKYQQKHWQREGREEVSKLSRETELC